MNEADLAQMTEQCEVTSQVLKSLAHPRRLQLLCFLSGGARTVTELQTVCGISQSQLSQFLQRMKSEGLVESRRESKFVYYSISDKKVHKLIRAVHKIFCP